MRMLPGELVVELVEGDEDHFRMQQIEDGDIQVYCLIGFVGENCIVAELEQSHLDYLKENWWSLVFRTGMYIKLCDNQQEVQNNFAHLVDVVTCHDFRVS